MTLDLAVDSFDTHNRNYDSFCNHRFFSNSVATIEIKDIISHQRLNSLKLIGRQINRAEFKRIPSKRLRIIFLVSKHQIYNLLIHKDTLWPKDLLMWIISKILDNEIWIKARNIANVLSIQTIKKKLVIWQKCFIKPELYSSKLRFHLHLKLLARNKYKIDFDLILIWF